MALERAVSLSRTASLPKEAHTFSSEDVSALLIHVLEVVQGRRVVHRLTVVDALPDLRLHVLAVHDLVLLHLLDVLVFRRTSVATNALVVASLEHVAFFEGTEQWLLLLLPDLLREDDVRAIGCFIRVEGAPLAHRVRPRLITVQNLRVAVRVLITTDVLPTLIGVLRVANLGELGNRVGNLARGEARSRLRSRSRRGSKRDILELRLPHLLVRACHEGLCLLRNAPSPQVVLARIDVGVTDCVALKTAESLFGALATVDSHATVEADLVPFLAEGLVVGAGVTHSERHWHREESIALPLALDVLLTSEVLSVLLVPHGVVKLVCR